MEAAQRLDPKEAKRIARRTAKERVRAQKKRRQRLASNGVETEEPSTLKVVMVLGLAVLVWGGIIKYLILPTMGREPSVVDQALAGPSAEAIRELRPSAEAALRDVQSKGWITKATKRGSAVDVFVTPLFFQRSYEEKGVLGQAAYVWGHNGDNNLLVVFKDYRTNERVGTWMWPLGLDLD